MGVVYRARRVDSDQVVALKTVKVLSGWLLESIRREIHALTLIEHPGVVRILEHGVHEERPWYTMDLLEGETLRAYLQRIWSPFRQSSPPPVTTEQLSVTEPVTATRTAALLGDATWSRQVARWQQPRSPLPAAGELQTVLRIMRDLCATLGFLHGEGVINRDLKPENVLIVRGDPILIDFGLTTLNLPRETLDFAGIPAGTVPYMSPEQLRGELVDARGDLYSFGCILYEALSGAPPFAGTASAVRAQHLAHAPARLASVVDGIPEALEQIVQLLLAKNVVDRVGFADEVAAMLSELLQEDPGLSHFPVPRAYLYRAGFVGRDAIMDRLRTLRARACGGEGGLVLLAGESGVGKTRIAMELTRSGYTTPMRIVASEVAPHAAGGAASVAPAALHALKPLLRVVAARCREGGPEVTQRLLGAGRRILCDYEPSLAAFSGDSEESTPIPLPPDAARRRLFRCLAQTIAALARELPILWVIDDLGWEDELSVAFLQSLEAEFFRATALLIVGTHRSDEQSERLAGFDPSHVECYRVERLDSTGVRSIVSDMLALRKPTESFVTFVAAETEGNPFFVAEYLRAAVSQRLLVRDRQHAWSIAGVRAEDLRSYPLQFPSSLQLLIEQRLSRLSEAALRTCMAAAVLGRETETALLREATELEEASLIGVLDELMRHEVLTQQRPEHVQFAHDKLREVAYAMVEAEPRKQLHARAARSLERRLRRTPEDSRLWGAIGQHCAAAQLHERAAHFLQRAADHARSTHANEEAVRLYRAAVLEVRAQADALTERQLRDLHEGLGSVLSLLGQREHARQAFHEALARSPEAPSAERARVYRQLGKTFEAEHRHEQALSLYADAERAAGLSPELADEACRAEWVQTQIEQLWVYYWLARVQDMDAIVQRVGPVIEQYGSRAQRARFFQTRALANMRRERYAISPETLSYARAAVSASDHPSSLAEAPMAQFVLGLSLLLANALSDADLELTRADALARRTGDAGHRSRCLTYLTVTARRRGDLTVVRALVEDSERVSHAAQLREYVAAALANRAWLALHDRRPLEAERLAQAALEIWRELALVYPFQQLALLPLMRLHVVHDELERALACADQIQGLEQQLVPAVVQQAFAAASAAWAAGRSEQTTAALTLALDHLDPHFD